MLKDFLNIRFLLLRIKAMTFHSLNLKLHFDVVVENAYLF